MQFDNDFFVQAQNCVEAFFRSVQTEIMATAGKIKPSIKADNTPVTELDKSIELAFRDVLTKFDKNIGFYGEEFGRHGNKNTFWLVDPIDGTESFIRGLPYVRNMATLINYDEPVLTVIFKPIIDELFIARKGHGATKNGDLIHVSNRSIDRAWIELSTPLENQEVLPIVSTLRKHINGYRVIGDFTLVAEGKIDGHLILKSGGGPWDYAPRALLIAEAGGIVKNIGSDSYNYNNFDLLAANPIIFSEIMEIINNV